MPEEGGGGFLSQKIMGIPAIVVIGGVAILAYFILSRNKQVPANSTSGGGGQVHTGKTVVQSGAVRINVNNNDDGNPQPKPPHKGGGGATKSFTVPKDESLAQFGASRHWSQDTLNVDMPAFTQPKGSTYAGKKLTPDFKLKKGDKIFRPIGN